MKERRKLSPVGIEIGEERIIGPNKSSKDDRQQKNRGGINFYDYTNRSPELTKKDLNLKPTVKFKFLRIDREYNIPVDDMVMETNYGMMNGVNWKIRDRIVKTASKFLKKRYGGHEVGILRPIIGEGFIEEKMENAAKEILENAKKFSEVHYERSPACCGDGRWHITYVTEEGLGKIARNGSMKKILDKYFEN